MAKNPVIKVGFIGLGVVGQGVWKHLVSDCKMLENRLGVTIVPIRAAVSDVNRERAIQVDPEQLCEDPMAVATDPEVDILCELMGGVTIAREATIAALSMGKIVVTANKELLCHHGQELFEVARKNGGHYFFEASVAGGIPIIKSIREGLVANNFPLIFGILNGTCNYILTRMEREGIGFEEIVEDARKLGYVEADESLDLDGWDTAHKAVILAFLAHGKWVKLSDVKVEGIRNITLDDIYIGKELGNYKVKLLGIIRRDFESNKLSVHVHPTLISEREILARVDEVYNGVSVTGDVVGTTVHIGRGAGQDATASAVLSDIASAVGILKNEGKMKEVVTPIEEICDAGESIELATSADVYGKYYFRMLVNDRPGVLAEISSAMAKHEVSIESVRQQPRPGKTASLILSTYSTTEANIEKTKAELKGTEVLAGDPVVIRIF